MESLDFKKLNILFSSIEESFEEFCCQLAFEFEEVPENSKYYRFKGAGGDGGVECIWELLNGKVWGWQAKYVFDFENLKRQLYKSVETALSNYPNLERYFICIPFNLTGRTGKGEGQKEKFEKLIENWKKEIEDQRVKNVDFVLWDKTVLLNSLLNSKNADAKIKVWFGKNLINDNWFDEEINKAISWADPRYTPDLNIQTPIYGKLKCFENQCEEDLEGYLKKLNKLKKEWSNLVKNKGLDKSPQILDNSLKKAQEILDLIESLYSYLSKNYIRENIDDIFNNLLTILDKIKDNFNEDLQNNYGNEWGNYVAENPNFRQWMAEYEVSFPTANYDLAKESINFIKNLKDWVINYYSLVHEKFLLITGEAGIGKTHTIVDFAKYRLKNGGKSVLLFGDRFKGDDEPWEQILKQMDLSKNFSKNDFLETLETWGRITQKPVIIFIDALNETKPFGYWSKYLKLVVEDIKKYKWLKLCISCRSTYMEGCLPKNLKIYTIEHEGFKGIEFDALAEFLKFYNLPDPTIPILNPEFYNPLFLKILCETLQSKNITLFPNESLFFSELIKVYLENKEEKIADNLNYNSKKKLVRKALDQILEEIKNSKDQWISWEKADKICLTLWPGEDKDTSLLERLIEEGLLREDRKDEEDIILVSYERLRDFVLAEKYLKDYSSIDDLINEFRIGNLKFLIENIDENKGIFEALAILIPEKFNVEIYEIFNNMLDEKLINNLFLFSLKWRKASSFSEKTEKKIISLLRNEYFFKDTMNLIISKSIYPGFLINAEWLNNLLINIPMYQRDSWWVPYLHIMGYENNSEVKKIIDWVFKIDISKIDKKVGELWAITLTWFLTSSNRKIRDLSTKALVKIFEDKPSIIPEILEKFKNIDDEYILERFLGAICGALIRNRDFKILSQVSCLIYKFYFENEKNVPINIKIRDYARLILEMALHFGILPKEIDIHKFRPPFRSKFPKKLPSDKEILKLEKTFEKHENKIAVNNLINSMQPEHTTLRGNFYGDFGRYVFQSALEIYDLKKNISIQKFSNLAVKMIFEDLNYDINTHGRFDRYLIAKYGVGRSKPFEVERIGKKYQWIALFRIMGLVTDNFNVKENNFLAPNHDFYSRKLNDIDTTFLMRKIYINRYKQTWWFPVNYDFEKKQNLTDEKWLKSSEDLPNIKNALIVKNPLDNEDYYILLAFPDWSSRKNENEYPYRNIWIHIRSYLVPKGKSDKFYMWLSKQNLIGRWMPEGFELSENFIGEYPWAIPYKKFFEHEEEWKEVKNFSINKMVKSTIDIDLIILREIIGENGKIEEDTYTYPNLNLNKEYKYSIFTYDLQKYPCKVNFSEFFSIKILPTTNTLKIEEASVDESSSIEVPAKFFFDKIQNLEWDGKGSYQLNNKNIFIFPNAYEKGIYTLLVNKQFMDEFLEKENLELIWTVFGEKQAFNTINNVEFTSFSVIIKKSDLQPKQR